jgi:hypothetical protein
MRNKPNRRTKNFEPRCRAGCTAGRLLVPHQEAEPTGGIDEFKIRSPPSCAFIPFLTCVWLPPIRESSVRFLETREIEYHYLEHSINSICTPTASEVIFAEHNNQHKHTTQTKKYKNEFVGIPARIKNTKIV